jgi:branched-subunit amino acid aminotransferase/4-amino-4-deoxychorismate lyase
VIEIGREIGIPASEAVLYLDDLASADEAFVTGTTRELTPVVRVDDRVIGTGKPGPVTTRLLDAFHTRALEIVSKFRLADRRR